MQETKELWVWPRPTWPGPEKDGESDFPKRLTDYRKAMRDRWKWGQRRREIPAQVRNLPFNRNFISSREPSPPTRAFNLHEQIQLHTLAFGIWISNKCFNAQEPANKHLWCVPRRSSGPHLEKHCKVVTPSGWSSRASLLDEFHKVGIPQIPSHPIRNT